MMTIREIESGSDIMEVNRLAGLIWHEAYRGIGLAASRSPT